jgi:hypothetical protein
MHCPNCRESNAATTRFCTACGAVLVENTPGGGRRRVLRPWGLRRSAPPTESPAMPDMAEARTAALRANGRARPRFDVVVVCGLAIVGAAGVVAYPFTSTHELARPDVADASPALQEATIVTVPAISSVRETQLASPALLEPPPAPPSAVKPKPVVQPPAEPAERKAPPQIVEPAPVVVAPEPMPAPRVEPRAASERPVAAAPVDRWQPLRAQLAACGAVDGLFQRAMCEQGARLAHCEGQWGETPLCPPGRTEYGQ